LVRRSDAHLSPAEIDLLVRSRSSGPGDAGHVESDTEEALQHLEACAVCQSTIDMHIGEQNRLAHLRGSAPAKRGTDCPPDSHWLRVAADLVEEKEAQAFIGHAAVCDHCGPLLRSNAADFEDELTPDEEIFLGTLKSCRADWQRRLATEMSGAQSRRRLLSGFLRRLWPSGGIPMWAYGGAAAALAVAAVFGIRLLQQTTVQTLLATAYTEQRTFELRIPNAAYAPVRRTRGSLGSRLDRPALLEAESRIARELQRRPATPDLLQAKGEADLLELKYEEAIDSFKRALDLAPGTPALMRDLASAYFESAETNHRASDYAAAIDLLDKVLQSAPDDPVALFNRAFVYERMNVRSRAIEDWKHYLRVDPNGGWALEVRRLLAGVEHETPKTP
jgi:tetratricopeptide (TPR) repeat protein